jgi:hypothetical protein
MDDEIRVTVVATGISTDRRIERPTVIRNREERVLPDLSDGNTDYLDIPAFLRRQAD